jgi:hypothetical protein
MGTRKELSAEKARQYRTAKTRKDKGQILDAFIADTGYHRKYAISILNGEGKEKVFIIDGKPVKAHAAHKTRKKRIYKRYYDEPVARAVIKLWKFFRRICGERLTPLIKENIKAICSRRRFGISKEVKAKLMKISRSTIERLITPERKKERLKGRSTTKKGTLLKNQIPVRVFWAWDDKKPGFCEIDTVSHDGGGEINSFYAWTLTVTDVCLGWTENRALKNKAEKWSFQAANDIYAHFPVPILGMDSDGGGEFINWHFKKWCEQKCITFTRGRSHHSNDNCFVEQKNGDVVRKTVGYARFEGEEVLAALNQVYSCLNPLLNYFYPSKKLSAKKVLPNGKVKKVYEKILKPPYQRLLEHPDITEEVKENCRNIKAKLDIIDLQDKLDLAVRKLDTIVLKSYSITGNDISPAAIAEQALGKNLT